MSEKGIAHDPKELPVMLPGKLIGREAVLAQVYAQLKENNTTLIYGEAGVGKTALAATLATAYAQQPGGVLWLSVDHPRLEELLVRVGRAYDVKEITNSDTPLGMVGAVENTLRTNKPFIVIDGEIDGGILARFISRCVTDLPVLVATPEPHVGMWETIEVPRLTTEQAVALFKREGRVAVNEDENVIAHIVDLVDPLPFSVIVAARAMVASKRTPPAFADILDQVAQSTEQGPSVALTTSFRTLNGALQGLVLMMGAMFDGGAGPELLSMVSGAPQESVAQAMNILTQLHIVERINRAGDFYYRMHPITHAFARRYLVNAGKLEGLQTKVRTSVTQYAAKYSTGQNNSELYREMDTFLATARWARENDQKQIALELADLLNGAGDFVQAYSYTYEIVQMRDTGARSTGAFPAYPEDALPDAPILDEDDESSEYEVDEDALEVIDESEEIDVEETSGALSPEAMMELPPEKIDFDAQDETQLRSLLGRVRQEDDVDSQIEILQSIGDRQVEKGMENEAISTYNELLEAYEAQDDDDGTLETLDMLSALMVKTGNAQPAVMHATRGIKLAQDLSDRENLLQLYMTLGDARQQLGESGQAIDDYTEALSVARQTDDTQHEAIVLYKLGFAQLDDGDTPTAIDTFEQALSLFKTQNKRGYEGRVMGGLGSAYGDLERWEEAVSFHTSALYIAREVIDKEEEALQLSSLAYAALRAGNLSESLLRYRQALHLAFEAGDKDNIVSLLVDVSRLLMRSRRHAHITELLLDTAAEYEANDKDIVQLRQKLEDVQTQAEEHGTMQKPVKGDARRYAANAYRLLEE
jgi:tetratricopeptide (TPR) repeat protein